MSELANVQRWLTSIIIKPGKLNDKIALADETYKLTNTSVIRSSASMSSGQKIGIYARGYVLRLIECMSAEYAAVQHLLGDDLFNTFVKAYLLQSPSRSPDLYDLGKSFPEFLKASQPENNGDDDAMFGLPVELAVFERALAEVSRIKGLENMEIAGSDNEQVLFLFGTAAFQASPCLTLLQLQYPVIDFIKAVQRGEEAALPDKKHNYVAISRKNYRVNMHQLEPWQWHFLQSLQSTGNYMLAVDSSARASGTTKDTLMADLLLWIPLALNFGYIYQTE
jgi:hypothetical protein